MVTFNSEQQTLIEDLLDEARSRDPSIEWAFSPDGKVEPVFVKNLETVQGDERDVIMFSITYGPDHADHVTMNFGPLNRDGGERRLNVAITRSRSEMLVFSTLSPDRIDLSRTQARAVADLKHFLQYAERGPAALGAQVHGSLGDFESPFEVAVARALRDKGWEIHPQIGVSRYRIDLGIVHPDAGGTYLAGIECDGAMYHSAAFARERDKIRQTVLEGLGWTLFRVWSTDWWTHKAKALQTLYESLTSRLETDRQERREGEESGRVPGTEDVPAEVGVDSDAAAVAPERKAFRRTTVVPDVKAQTEVTPARRTTKSTVQSPVAVTWALCINATSANDGVPPPRAELSAAALDAGVTFYTAQTQVSAFLKWHKQGRPEDRTPRGVDVTPASAPKANTASSDTSSPGTAEAGGDRVDTRPIEADGDKPIGWARYVEWTPTGHVADPRSAKTHELAALLAEVVACEGPIVALRAYRAINHACGSRRLTRRARKALNQACYAAVQQGLVVAANPLDLTGQGQHVLRSPECPEVVLRQRGPRQLDELPPDEVAAILRSLRAALGSVDVEDLKREALGKLGWVRLTRNVSDFLDRCAALM